MATKFLKSPNGGIYKDSNGKPIAVEPERVIRDIDGNITASTLEDISVSTGTASTNGVSYIRATMKGEVTYTDNTHDTINYYIDLPIKAGDGVTIEAQPIEGGTGNKQIVISASGGGGTTLNKYTLTGTLTGQSTGYADGLRLYNIFANSKGRVLFYTESLDKSSSEVNFCNNLTRLSAGSQYNIGLHGANDTGSVFMERVLKIYFSASGTTFCTATLMKFENGTWTRTNTALSYSIDYKVEYWNDTEITA